MPVVPCHAQQVWRTMIDSSQCGSNTRGGVSARTDAERRNRHLPRPHLRFSSFCGMLFLFAHVRHIRRCAVTGRAFLIPCQSSKPRPPWSADDAPYIDIYKQVIVFLSALQIAPVVHSKSFEVLLSFYSYSSSEACTSSDVCMLPCDCKWLWYGAGQSC